MNWLIPNHSTELNKATNDLLQILLTKFHLFRENNKIHLRLSFNETTPAIRRRDSKSVVKKNIKSFKKEAKKIQNKLDLLFFQNRSDEYIFNEPGFVFRYASGGSLPIINLEGKSYFCFFYREVDPIGWNIANGGSDSLKELLDPRGTILRELQEELLLFDLNDKKQFVFTGKNKSSYNLPEYDTSIKLWQEYFPEIDMKSFNKKIATFNWINGPDSLTVCYRNEKPVTILECYININAIDFGIEVDQVVIININNNIQLLDGEIIDNKLLNRPIGLFDIHRFISHSIKDIDYTPDKLFYDGKQRHKNEFNDIIYNEYFTRIFNKELIRNIDLKKKWDKEKHKFKLCPVTKTIINRFKENKSNIFDNTSTNGTFKKQHKSDYKYDVFISHSKADKKKIMPILENFKKYGISYWIDHEQISPGDFITNKIEEGLQNSRIVLVCTSNNLKTSNWCKAEYGSILNMELTKTTGRKVIPLKIDDVDDNNIPILLYDKKRVDYNKTDEFKDFLNFLRSKKLTKARNN